MASYGWMINLSGKSIPVYSVAGGGPSTTKIGNLTKNECFVEGTFSANPWEGDDAPVFFLNSSHQMTFGLLADYENNLVDFTAYASNGTSWVSVNTLERKVQCSLLCRWQQMLRLACWFKSVVNFKWYCRCNTL